MVDTAGVLAALEGTSTLFDNLRVVDLSTEWEHELSALPSDEGNGITDKFFNYSSVTRSGPDVQVNEGGHLVTKESGSYGAGKIAIPGAGGHFDSSPTGDQDGWIGYTDKVDGAGVGWDSSGIYVFNVRNNSGDIPDSAKVYQSDWNVRKLDGTFDNGPDFDPSDGFILRLPHAAYGHAKIPIVIGVKIDSSDSTNHGDGEFELYHVHNFNEKGQTMWTNFDHPIRWEFNGTEGDGNFLAATACHYQTETGRSNKRINGQSWTPQFNNGNQLALNSHPSWTYLIGFRKRGSDWDKIDVTPNTFTVNANQNVEVQITRAGSFTDTAYGLPEDTSGTEVALEYDLATYDLSAASFKGSSSFTSISDVGEREWTATIPGDKQEPLTTGGQLEDLVITGEEPIALLARPATDTATSVAFVTLTNGGNF